LLIGFTYSDWVDDPNDRNSTASYVFSLGSRPVTWDYKKQQVISLYLAKAEYQTVVNSIQETLWL
jgi:hypothetical protein